MFIYLFRMVWQTLRVENVPSLGLYQAFLFYARLTHPQVLSILRILFQMNEPPEYQVQPYDTRHCPPSNALSDFSAFHVSMLFSSLLCTSLGLYRILIGEGYQRQESPPSALWLVSLICFQS